ncbi:MAG: hypothetical protein E7L17_14120 [Clostridium sp.]|uniref:hypothetical protein n=1 Tax=Clostridium sp. TaxID=1506 RepID=UPI0029116B0C|nr:hypothetical protein [Clostridium sp.]MDU7339235.1 hypothetical protein [Clostridium sp.]
MTDYSVEETAMLYSALQSNKDQLIGQLQNPYHIEDVNEAGEGIRTLQPLMAKVKQDYISRGGDASNLQHQKHL